MSCQELERDSVCDDVRCTARTVSRDRCSRPAENTAKTAFAVQMLHDVEHTLVLRATLALTLYLIHLAISLSDINDGIGRRRALAEGL